MGWLAVSPVRASRPDREWIAQRVGWVVLVAFMLGGLLGLFGGGPLSHSTARDPQGVLEVDYPRFDRNIGYASLQADRGRRRRSGRDGHRLLLR